MSMSVFVTKPVNGLNQAQGLQFNSSRQFSQKRHKELVFHLEFTGSPCPRPIYFTFLERGFLIKSTTLTVKTAPGPTPKSSSPGVEKLRKQMTNKGTCAII